MSSAARPRSARHHGPMLPEARLPWETHRVHAHDPTLAMLATNVTAERVLRPTVPGDVPAHTVAGASMRGASSSSAAEPMVIQVPKYPKLTVEQSREIVDQEWFYLEERCKRLYKSKEAAVTAAAELEKLKGAGADAAEIAAAQRSAKEAMTEKFAAKEDAERMEKIKDTFHGPVWHVLKVHGFEFKGHWDGCASCCPPRHPMPARA